MIGPHLGPVDALSICPARWRFARSDALRQLVVLATGTSFAQVDRYGNRQDPPIGADATVVALQDLDLSLAKFALEPGAHRDPTSTARTGVVT